MTPALIASIVTSVVALVTALGLWIRSRANMNNELTKILADRATVNASLTKIIQDRAATKADRDRKFDDQDIEIANIKKDLAHEKETSARLEKDLEKNTNGLKDDINDLKKETNAKLNQLDFKLTNYQDNTTKSLGELMDRMNKGFTDNAVQIATLQGTLFTKKQ